jgi:hypothetical protein
MPTFVIRPSSAEPFPLSPQSSGRSLPSFSSGSSKEDFLYLLLYLFQKCIDKKKTLNFNRVKNEITQKMIASPFRQVQRGHPNNVRRE